MTRDANSPTGNDPRGIGGLGNSKLPYPGERGIFYLFLGFRVGESGNKNTKYRHSFESLVHNHHYTLEILGFHYMQLSKFKVKYTKFLFHKDNFYN